MIGKRHIRFIGLGMMGGAMVKNFLRSGFIVNVFDVDERKTEFFKELGAHLVA